MAVNKFLSPFITVLFLTLSNAPIFPQDSLAISFEQPEITDSLNVLGMTILTDSLVENRIQASNTFKTILMQELKNQSDFSIAYDSLKSVSIETAPDSTFRIFTWQLFINDDEYKYEGIIQLNNLDKELISLTDNSSEYMSVEFEQGDEDHWFGNICYKILPFESFEGEKSYLLFGLNTHSLMERKKIIDVLTINEDGVSFGLSVFLKSEESRGHPPTKSRVIVDYFAGAAVKVNYDESKSQILFDHLIFKSTPYGEFLIPDGSYEGYTFSEGYWKHVPKIYDHIYDEAPRPEPVFNENKDEKLDIFGKKLKKRQ